MPIESNQSTTVVIDGIEYLYFGGTNYLGLAHRPELLNAAMHAFDQYGFSAGASRLTSGENTLMLELERDLARFAGCEDALVLPAGFITNAAVVDGLDEMIDFWIVSKFAHGSIKAAVAQSSKPVLFDDPLLDDGLTLRQRHELPADCSIGIFAEPIDPLLGRLLDLPHLLECSSEGDLIVLDEAHSFGVLGNRGEGVLEHFGIKWTERFVRTGTFSKALGSYGGFVLASRLIINLIKQRSGTYKVSTPVTPLACAASRASIKLMTEERDTTIDKLKENIAATNSRLIELGFPQFKDNPVPIYHLVDSPAVSRLREDLPGLGMYLPTVTSYFADFCEIGIRWTVQAGHSVDQLQRLLNAIGRYIQ
jgi:8-amino-7-oxononanoate synthase